MEPDQSVEEIHAEADAVFALVDQDGDGAISYAELQAHLLGCGYAQEAVDAIWYTLDADTDGSVLCDELRAGFVRYAGIRGMKGMGNHRPGFVGAITVDAVFDAIDADGAGAGISNDELRWHLRGKGYGDETIDRFFETLDVNFDHGEDVRADADAIFDKIDADGDGTISNDELRTHFRERGYTDIAIDKIFATLDVDLDGEISRDELCEAFVKYSALRFASGSQS